MGKGVHRDEDRSDRNRVRGTARSHRKSQTVEHGLGGIDRRIEESKVYQSLVLRVRAMEFRARGLGAPLFRNEPSTGEGLVVHFSFVGIFFSSNHPGLDIPP